MTHTQVTDKRHTPAPDRGAAADRRPAPGKTRPSGIGAFLRRRRGQGAFEISLLFLLLQAVLIGAALAQPGQFRYLSSANINVMLQSIPVLAILALGVGVLMISGEFDLSVGANYIFSSIVMGTQLNRGMNPILAVGLGVAAGAVIGLTNGLITVRFRIPSFIVTLGTMSFWGGAVFFYNGTGALNFTPSDTLRRVLVGGPSVLPAQAIWLLGFGVVFWALLHRHRVGNHIFAVGGNRAAAAAIGIRTNRVKVIAFTMTGICAAVAGELAAVQVGSVQPGSCGTLALQAIAACVVGGVALYGGSGSAIGMVLGAALLYTIQDILLLRGAPGFYLDVFVGMLIVAAAILNQFVRGRTT
jgi:simple sugar transport system permease protein